MTINFDKVNCVQGFYFGKTKFKDGKNLIFEIQKNSQLLKFARVYLVNDMYNNTNFKNLAIILQFKDFLNWSKVKELFNSIYFLTYYLNEVEIINRHLYNIEGIVYKL